MLLLICLYQQAFFSKISWLFLFNINSMYSFLAVYDDIFAIGFHFNNFQRSPTQS